MVAHVLGFLTPTGRLSLGFLPLTWTSPGSCGHLGSKPAGRRSLFLSHNHSAFQKVEIKKDILEKSPLSETKVTATGSFFSLSWRTVPL